MQDPLKLSGHTRPYAVLGHPIGHSLSPVMHNASLRSLGLDAIYLAFDVHPDKLLSVLSVMRDMGFGGVNLTVPLKEVAFRGLSELAESAQRLGAVNTVEFCENGDLRGHNTDGDGFVRAVEEAFGAGPEQQSVFVLGCGGAGRAVALTCAAAGASSLTISDVEQARAEKLRDELLADGRVGRVSICASDVSSWGAASRDADLVVQCTPVGMKSSDASLLPSTAFRAGQRVFDLVYMYPLTGFLANAAEAGAATSNGLNMLLYQGARAFTIWTGQEPDVAAMRTALEAEVYRTAT
ncbi:MAG: shikimate dehydrogenase [Verrucomicrobia bacterium]|nr:shikimate dehydrogenase [Verrucomicrobiota bacterium]